MKEEILRQIIEQADPENKIPRNIVDELVASLEAVETPKEVQVLGEGATEAVLVEQMNVETDWRKKASIAAKIISFNLS